MKVFKFNNFPDQIFYNDEEYKFMVGGEKCIEVHVGSNGKVPDRYIFFNVIN